MIMTTQKMRFYRIFSTIDEAVSDAKSRFLGRTRREFRLQILNTLAEAEMLAFVRSRRIADDQHTGVQVHDEQRSSPYAFEKFSKIVIHIRGHPSLHRHRAQTPRICVTASTRGFPGKR
jgi:hypothetical protein